MIKNGLQFFIKVKNAKSQGLHSQAMGFEPSL